MIRPIIIYLLLHISLLGDPSKPHHVEDIRWGKKAKNTIKVLVGGDVAKPGKYYLPKGVGLKSILGFAGGYAWNEQRTHYSDGMGQFRGRVRIYRKNASGNEVYYTYELRNLQMKDSTDIEIQDGDRIHFPNIKIWEK